MSDSISQVNRLAGPRLSPAELPANALEHGALTLFDDNTAVFTGNGKTSIDRVMGRIIELESERFPELKPFVEPHEAHLYAAHRALQQHNPHLKNQDPEKALPAGEQFYTNTGMELKNLLAPFKNNLGALRQLVADSKTALGGKSIATGHGIYSQGLGLPVGPEPASVPAGNAGVKPVRGS